MQTEAGPAVSGWDEPTRSPRADRVPTWVPYVAVAVVAVLSGVLARRTGAAPTGEAGPDRILTFLVAAVTTGLGALAPWWVLAVAAVGALVAAVVSGTAGLVVLAAVAVAAVVVVYLTQRWAPPARVELVPAALTSAAVTQVALQLEGGFHGRSALIAAALLGVLVLGALASELEWARWLAGGVAALTGVAAIAAIAGATFAGVQARGPVSAGIDGLRDGFDALQAGDNEQARDAFAEAEGDLGAAGEHLRGRWGSLARWLPLVAQHRSATLALLDAGSRLAETGSRSAGELDPDALRYAAGRIDPAALVALRRPLDDLDAALVAAREDVAAARSPWLLWLVDDALDDLDERLVDAGDDTETARLVADVVPGVLGADGPRRYLVLFLNPATARGLGGQIGGFASVVARDGQLEVERTGGLGDLVLAMPPDGVPAAGDPLLTELELLVEPSTDGAPAQADGMVRPQVWSELTRSADLAAAGRAAAVLYPASGGAPIDGVVTVDPEGVAVALALTGPLGVEGLDAPLTQENVVAHLVSEQFAAEGAVDALPAITSALVSQLLAAELPPPREVGELVRPVVDEGRIGAWLARPEEQALLDHVRATPALPPPPGDVLAVTFDNDIGNAIDPYVAPAATYDVTLFPAAGRVTAELTVVVRNSAPASGLSVFAIGNFTGQPLGTSRTSVGVVTPLGLDRAELDGQPVEPVVSRAGERRRLTVPLTLGAGEEATLRFTLTGDLADVVDELGDYVLAVRPQPGALPIPMDVTIGVPEGIGLEAVEGPVGLEDGRLRFAGEPAEPFVVRASAG